MYEDDSFVGLRVSMVGGGYINIAAKGESFDTDTLNNTASFITTLPGATTTTTMSVPAMTGKKHTLASFSDL